MLKFRSYPTRTPSGVTHERRLFETARQGEFRARSRAYRLRRDYSRHALGVLHDVERTRGHYEEGAGRQLWSHRRGDRIGGDPEFDGAELLAARLRAGGRGHTQR